MKKKGIIMSSVLIVLLLAGALAGPVMSLVETPDYQVIEQQGDIEIRQYDTMIIAEVETEGSRKESASAGFRLLADYIFGNNLSNKDISMTAPVQQQESQKIAMTAPVQQQSQGNTWLISFVMPSEYSITDLPTPQDSRVTIKTIPSLQYVAIKFSGRVKIKNIKKNEHKLLKYIEKENISIQGTAKYAFYNPPWTLPFMRKNEVMFQITP